MTITSADALSSPGSAQVVHHLEEVMGTIVTIDIYLQDGISAAHVSPSIDRAVSILHKADEVFSTWNPQSPMSRIRRGDMTLAQAPPELGEVLGSCATAREITGGWFDPWAMPGGVNPTGYVKGWAAQCALDALVRPGVLGAVVNAAGDIASFGGPRDSVPFRFGIVDPRTRDRLALVVETTGALATSGTYERGAHLIDPRSGQAIARVASASVTGPDLGMADALATAIAVAGDEGLRLVGPVEGYEALTISWDGTSKMTAAFPLAVGLQ